jgi:hypothetical protein
MTGSIYTSTMDPSWVIGEKTTANTGNPALLRWAVAGKPLLIDDYD